MESNPVRLAISAFVNAALTAAMKGFESSLIVGLRCPCLRTIQENGGGYLESVELFSLHLSVTGVFEKLPAPRRSEMWKYVFIL